MEEVGTDCLHHHLPLQLHPGQQRTCCGKKSQIRKSLTDKTIQKHYKEVTINQTKQILWRIAPTLLKRLLYPIARYN